MNKTPIYVLVELSINGKGEVVRKNVGVTFDVHEAEAHQAEGVEKEYEQHSVDANWQEQAAQSELVDAMRTFRGMVQEMQEEALR